MSSPWNCAVPTAVDTVLPVQLPVCWRSPVSALKIVLFPTFGLPARTALYFDAPPSDADSSDRPVDDFVSPIFFPPFRQYMKKQGNKLKKEAHPWWTRFRYVCFDIYSVSTASASGVIVFRLDQTNAFIFSVLPSAFVKLDPNVRVLPISTLP